jgi:hypothetical protein
MSLPVPDRSAASCCGGSKPSFLAGLVIGAVLIGAVATVYRQREMQRMAEMERMAAGEVAAPGLDPAKAGLNLVDGVLGQTTRTKASPESEAEQVKALGDATVDDLRQDRLLSVYRLTTRAYRDKMPRDQFEEMVHKVTGLRQAAQAASQRETKVRKATEGPGYEYYCTAQKAPFAGVVNFAFTFVPGDNGDWRIDELEVSEVK